MAKNINSVINSAKENQKVINNCVKGANVELKGVLSNPFAGINYLNKVVSGKIGGGLLVEGLNIDNVKRIAAELKKIHGGRYPFSADVLIKDNKGRFCTIETSKKMPIWDYQLTDIIGGRYEYYKPINLNIVALFNAFAKVVKADAAAKVAKAKADADAAKVATTKKARFDVVYKVFGELAHTFTEDEINDKYNIIKAA